MSTKPRPMVSVVIPCYNAEAFIKEAVYSALVQTVSPCEVLVIDDGSTDKSVDALSLFGNSVRVIPQFNHGESIARNRGMAEARGEWIAFLDADDIWHPTKLERQLACIRPEAVCIHTAYYTFGRERRVCCDETQPSRRYSVEYMCCRSFLIPSAAMVRREVRSRFPTWTSYGEDLIFFLDLVLEGEFHQVPEALTGQRKHAHNQSTCRRCVEIDWHRSVLAWLQLRQGQIEKSVDAAVRAGWRQRLTRAAAWSFLRGDRSQYREYCDYVRAMGGPRFPLLQYFATVSRRAAGLLRH